MTQGIAVMAATQIITLNVSTDVIDSERLDSTGFADVERDFPNSELKCKLSYDGESQLMIEVIENPLNFSEGDIKKYMEFYFQASEADDEPIDMDTCDEDEDEDDNEEEDEVFEDEDEDDDGV